MENPAPLIVSRHESKERTGWRLHVANSSTDVAFVDDVDYGPECAEGDARRLALAYNCHAGLLAALKNFPGKSCGEQAWYSWIGQMKRAIAETEKILDLRDS